MKWLDKVKAFFNYEENVEDYLIILFGFFLFAAVMLGIWEAKWHEKNTKTVFGYKYSAETVVYDKCEYAALKLAKVVTSSTKAIATTPFTRGKLERRTEK